MSKQSNKIEYNNSGGGRSMALVGERALVAQSDEGSRASASQRATVSELRKNNVFRLQTEIDLQYDPVDDSAGVRPYRDAVCFLCEKTVSLALDVPLSKLQARNRCSADVALARQIAMYLCHTTFSVFMSEVGLHFGRDRTTVSHAVALVENKREELAFDVLICQLESLLCDARHAMSICIEHQLSSQERMEPERPPAKTPTLYLAHGNSQ